MVVDYMELIAKERSNKEIVVDEPMNYEYHEVCLWLPHKPDVVEDIAKDMMDNGFRPERAIVTFEGKILDGRHRYEAAVKVGVDPVFTEFEGGTEEAIYYVTSENVARRHLSNREKEYFYEKRVEVLGVRDHGGDRKSEEAKIKISNDHLIPTQAEHAAVMGVGKATVSRWERDRKEIKADPELAEKATTPEGYQEAKKVVRDRRKEQREAIHNAVAPKTVDLHAIAKSKEGLDIRNLAPAFTGLMETLCSKFDENDIKWEMAQFLSVDPLGLRVEALHRMAGILADLCEDFTVTETKKNQLN